MLRMTALVAALLLITVPAAAEDEESVAETETTYSAADFLTYWFDAAEGILHFALISPDDLEPPSCAPAEDAAAEAAESGELLEEEEQECEPVDVTKADGTITHGSIQSSIVHALQAHRDELTGPFGHYVKMFAQAHLEDDVVAGDQQADDGTGDAGTGHGNQGNRGQNGPPDHANAHGRRGR